VDATQQMAASLSQDLVVQLSNRIADKGLAHQLLLSLARGMHCSARRAQEGRNCRPMNALCFLPVSSHEENVGVDATCRRRDGFHLHDSEYIRWRRAASGAWTNMWSPCK
jgi:hypothetical protein